MGKLSKSSRKGKKAWRANISTEDFEDYFEKTTKDALSGGSLADVPSDAIFFVDKSRDLSIKRKIEKSREKVLRCDSMLQRNAFVQPVPSSIQKKKTSKKNKKSLVEVAKGNEVTQDTQKADNAPDSGLADLWTERGEDSTKSRKKPKSSVIPAVEVEPEGCSFNPDPDSHQDALARAVADEMQKIYRTELGPEPIPLIVPGEAIADEDRYFLEADGETDDEDQNGGPTDDDGDAEKEKRSLKTKRVTRVELNRRAKRKEQLKAEAESKKIMALTKEIDSLPDIIQQIEKEDQEKHNRHLRRIVAKQERLKVRPPRLGKYKFEPAPLQVLLSEEKTGSLRQLKGCCTLVKDRFKSLEKRGLIVPSKKGNRK